MSNQEPASTFHWEKTFQKNQKSKALLIVQCFFLISLYGRLFHCKMTLVEDFIHYLPSCCVVVGRVGRQKLIVFLLTRPLFISSDWLTGCCTMLVPVLARGPGTGLTQFILLKIPVIVIVILGKQQCHTQSTLLTSTNSYFFRPL